MLEIDVDVRRLLALGRDEALEQEIDLGRIDIGDGEAIADGRIGGGTPALAEDALRAREADNVVDSEEVASVVQFGDERELLPQRIANPIRNAVAETPSSAFPGEIFEMRL